MTRFRPTIIRAFVGGLLGAAAVIVLAGCEANVTAVLPTGAPFTLYGILSPAADTQWVRVFPIEETIDADSGARFDVRVRSLDLASGQEISWTPDETLPSRNTFGRLFFAHFSAEHSHSYLIEAIRSDGVSSSAEVTIPSEATVEIGEGTTAYPVVVPVDVLGRQMRLLNVRLKYTLDYRYAPPVPVDAPPPDPLVQLKYTEYAVQTDVGWLIPVNLTRDFSLLVREIQVRSGAQINRLYGLRIREMELEFVAASSDWNPPDGIFDPEVLVQPGTLSNVSNGFGFIGAGYGVKVDWLPPDELVRAAGFFVPRDTSSAGG